MVINREHGGAGPSIKEDLILGKRENRKKELVRSVPGLFDRDQQGEDMRGAFTGGREGAGVVEGGYGAS